MSLLQVSDKISNACQKAGRPSSAVKLIAVSKVQPNDRVLAVLEQGHRIFGENRVQEAEGKWPAFKENFSGVELHLLGPLQTNKTRAALELFNCIQSLDRPKLAKAIARIAQEIGYCASLFVQVNTGLEDQKIGINPTDVDEFIASCRSMDLPVVGLMCIPPAAEEASLHFALLSKLAERNGIFKLSMGMSDDFGKAISFGATHVRVGSAIFGARVAPAPS